MNFSAYVVKKGLRIPNSINQLVRDEGIVIGLLKEIYHIDSKIVEEVEVNLLEEGDITGNLSDSGRVNVKVLTTDMKKIEYNWFVKVMPSHQGNNTLVAKFNVFKNEIEFYSKIAPKLKKLLSEAGDSNINLNIPELLYSDQQYDEAIIVMDDLASQGFKQERDANGDRYLSKEKAILAVETVANMHAASYALQRKNNVDLAREHPSLEESGLFWTRDEMTTRLNEMKETYCNLLEQSNKPDSGSLLARFKKAFSSSSKLREMCRNRCLDQKALKCLQQGDFHFNNLMFRNTGETLEVRLVDWQLTYTGRVGGDMSYLLMSSLAPGVREVAEHEIKDRYYRRFYKLMGLLDCHMIHKMGLLDCQMIDKMEEDYATDLKLGFFFSCGNVMTQEKGSLNNINRKVSFTYQLCKEAAKLSLI